MKIKFVSIIGIIYTATAQSLSCGDVQAIYQLAECCEDHDLDTCAHALSVNSTLLELSTGGVLTTTAALNNMLTDLTTGLGRIATNEASITAIQTNKADSTDLSLAAPFFHTRSVSGWPSASTHPEGAEDRLFFHTMGVDFASFVNVGDGLAVYGGLTDLKTDVVRVKGRLDVLHKTDRFVGDINNYIFRVQERTQPTTDAEIYINGRVQFDGGVADFRTSSDIADYPSSFINSANYRDISSAATGRPYPSGLLGVKVSEGVFAGAYHAASDRRIKRNIVDADTVNLLTQVRSIPMRNYGYKDKAGNTVGFIAQELADISEAFVSLTHKAIPDIRKSQVPATLLDNKLVLDMGGDENIQVGEVLAIDTKSGQKDMEVIDSVDGKLYLKVDTTDDLVLINGNMVGVYGRVVDDFHTINKDRIMATAVGALQEVDKTQQALLATVADLLATVADLTARLAALEA